MKSKIIFLAPLSVLFLTRISLFNPDGRYFFGDEIFYKRLIVTLIESEKTNNPLLFWQGIFGIHAKPGFGIVYSLPIWGEARMPNVPYGAILNVLINCLIPILCFLIIKKLVGQKVAVFATSALIFSISSVFYIRHMLPYDVSIVIFLIGLYLYLRVKSVLLFATISAISFLTYPSYFYYFIPIPVTLVIFGRPRLKGSVLFISGFICVVLFAQLASIAIGAKPSYLEEAQRLSGVVTQGDFIPALNFLAEYIISYDGFWGIILVAVAPLIILFGNRKKFFPLIIYLLLVFLILELFSHITSKTVLYGRTIRPFYLLLLISGAMALESLFRKLLKAPLYWLLFCVFLITSLLNWLPRFDRFQKITYPEEFRVEVENYLQDMHPGNYMVEDVYTKKRWEEDFATDPPVLEQEKFYIGNPTLLYPYFGNVEIPCKKDILISREHAMTFSPYQFEGFTKKMREFIIEDPPKYQLIYCEDLTKTQ